MKKLTTIFLLLIPFVLSAQEFLYGVLPTKDGSIYYSGVVQADSTAAGVLYDKAHEWFVKTYGSGKAVIQIADRESGMIIGKGNIPMVFNMGIGKTPIDVWHIIKIEVKDGRWRYEITDLKTSTENLESWCVEMQKVFPKRMAAFAISLDTEIKAMITSLTEATKSRAEQEW